MTADVPKLLLTPTDLSGERRIVTLAIKRLRAVLLALPPANPPERTAPLFINHSRGIATRTHPIVARAMRSMMESLNDVGDISGGEGIASLSRSVIATNMAVSDFRNDGFDAYLCNGPCRYIVVPLAHKNSLKPVIRLMLGEYLLPSPYGTSRSSNG